LLPALVALVALAAPRSLLALALAWLPGSVPRSALALALALALSLAPAPALPVMAGAPIAPAAWCRSRGRTPPCAANHGRRRGWCTGK